jgi:uncharacterized protein (TIGR04255 family)
LNAAIQGAIEASHLHQVGAASVELTTKQRGERTVTTLTLPDFENPPLAEVALSVQFESIAELRTPQIGLLWTEFRSRFPSTEEYPPLNAVIERFGVPRTDAPEVRFQMLETPPVPRVWFVNEGGTELIQVQQDRFIHNWRKVGEGDAYPRYEQIRDAFRAELETFQNFLSREQLGRTVPNQCEVTYVNHIVAGSEWEHHGQLGNILTVFRIAYSDAGLNDPEDARLTLRYVLKNASGEAAGRLHIAVQPAYRRSDGQAMLVLTLTARAAPAGIQLDDVVDCLNRGREAIVRAFASVTTPEMHKLWGRKDV